MILQKNIMEKTFTNKVRHTLRLGGSWILVILNSRVREKKNIKNIFWEVVLCSLERGCPNGHPFKMEMQDFKNFHMP